MKLFLNLLTMAAVSSLPGVAWAQSSLGEPMDVVLGIERAFGFYTGKGNLEDDNGAEAEYDSQGFSMGWSHSRQPMPVHIPRFSFDIFVIESLSVGTGFGFVSQDNDDLGGDGRGGLIFAPRVGYFIDFSQYFGFWPRGGFTLYDLDDPDQSQMLLTLEANFTFAPREGFGFLFGPVIDLGFTGEFNDADLREQSFGIAIGMFGWL
jgi:hypothetical protein